MSAWRAALDGDGAFVSAIPLPFFATVFRGSLALGFAAYAALCWFTWRHPERVAGFFERWQWRLAVPLVFGLALLLPANLSTDVFAYVGYARLPVVHGLNPYLHTQSELVRLGDPTAPYLRWPIASPYGPLWTLLSMGVVALSPRGSVLAPAIVFKLLAGVALLSAAALARVFVRRRDSARAPAVFLLVALNPLLLIEGPGNGHNDLLMVTLLLSSFAAVDRRRWWRAGLLLGLSASIKPVTLLALPWLAVLVAREGHGALMRRLAVGSAAALMAFAVVAAAYAPFWSGRQTLGGLDARWRHGEGGLSSDSSRPPARASQAVQAASEPTAQARISSSRGWTVRQLALRVWPILIVLIGGTIVVARGGGDSTLRLITVWSVAALAVLMFATGLWFPWYLAWLWPSLVLRFTRFHIGLFAFALPFSLLLMIAYAMPPG